MSQTRLVLIVVGGLPGSGKSTLAAGIARELGVPVIAKDELEAALWRTGVGAARGSWNVGNELLATVAATFAAQGRDVLLDSVFGLASLRRRLLEVATEHGRRIEFIECRCSDEAIHRARLDGRVRGIPGWHELTWRDVERSRAHYEPWDEPRLVLDALDPIEANLETALRHLAGAR